MPRFRRAVLLYNPMAGTSSERETRVRAAAEILRPLASELHIESTHAAGSGATQARQAIEGGCDLLLACGGDGTVFDILQGVARTQVTLGVIPLGTGNVLATDLALPSEPIAAARALLEYVPQRIALGRITTSTNKPSYFTVAAGVGVHAELIYQAGTAAKQRRGVAAYYLSGFRLLFAHPFVPFTAEITAPDGTVTREEVLEIVAMRVSSFGLWLKRWRPGSSLTSAALQLVVLRKSSRWAMARYVFGALTGGAHRDDQSSRSADVRFLPATSVRCYATGDAPRIRAQADGETLGAMPIEMEIVPDSLSLLMPPTKTR